MKKLAAIAAFAAAFTAAPAFADTLQNGYGNTFVVTMGSETVHYEFNADGTFSAIAGGQTQTGRYESGDGQLCFLGAEGARQCTELAADKNVGDTWQQRDTNGNEITVTLQAGRGHAGH